MKPEAIAARIAQSIRDGSIPPGTPLVQEDLASRFSVSRIPVREALRLLVADGLVTMSSGSGAAVRARSVDELIELYDLRIAIEPTIAAHITDAVSRRDIARLTEFVDRMDDATDVATWLDANYEFHVTLFRASGRERTAEILTGLLAAAQPYSRENIGPLGGAPQAQTQHREMIAAIEAGDPESLATVLVSHLEEAKARLVTARN